MRMVNIDLRENIAERMLECDVLDFIFDTLAKIQKEGHGSMRHMEHRMLLCHAPYVHFKNPLRNPALLDRVEGSEYCELLRLVHTVPVFLRELHPEDPRPENDEERRHLPRWMEEEGFRRNPEGDRPHNREGEEGEEQSDIIDLLGAYFPARNGMCAHIELYMARINHYAGADDDAFRRLTTLVLLHELVHAALDPCNSEYPSPIKVPYTTEFGRWREESMANAVALRLIKDANDSAFYDYARSFVLSQPPEYALGALMEPDSWGYWGVFRRKTEGQRADLQAAWLEYVQGHPTRIGLEMWKEILLRDTVNQDLFEEWCALQKGAPLSEADEKAWQSYLTDPLVLVYKGVKRADYDAVLKEVLEAAIKTHKLDSFEALHERFPFLTKKPTCGRAPAIGHISYDFTDGLKAAHYFMGFDGMKQLVAGAKSLGMEISYFQNW